jgi:hypothetical protein
MLKIENIQRIKGFGLKIKGFTFYVTDVVEIPDSYIFTLKSQLTVHAPKTMILKKQQEELGYYEMQEYGYKRYQLWKDDMKTPGTLIDQFQIYLNSY